MGPLVLHLLEGLKKRDQNVKHREKREDYKRAFILKVLFKDVIFFSGKHNSYKKLLCLFTYKFHIAHVGILESNILKEGPPLSVSNNGGRRSLENNCTIFCCLV